MLLLCIAFIIFVIIILLNIYLLDFLDIDKSREKFINDYYDKYIDVISVPSEFYNISAVLPEHQYTVEMNDRFYIDILNKYKIDTSIDYSNSPYINDHVIIDSILKRTNNYLVSLFNKNLPLNESFIFSNIFSKPKVTQKLKDINDIYILTSEHIIYRETKLYGVSITITTMHSNVDPKITLIDYKFNGYIFEDKIDAIEPSNLVLNNYQDYKKDKIQIKDDNYTNQYLCKYFNDLHKFRGLTVNTQGLNLDCPK